MGALLAVAAGVVCSVAPAHGGTADARRAAPTELHVLFVGNSLTYTNDLPALSRVLAQHSSPPANLVTEMIVVGGGDLHARLRDGVVARELERAHYDAIVLQERGGVLACLDLPELRDSSTCLESNAAHAALATRARLRDTRVLLFGTWSEDERRQRALSHALVDLGSRLHATPVDVGAAFCRARHATDLPPLVVDDTSRHPSLDGSLLAAMLFNRALFGGAPPTQDVDATLVLAQPHSPYSPQTLASQQPAPRPAQSVHIAASTLSQLWRAAQGAKDQRSDCPADQL